MAGFEGYELAADAGPARWVADRIGEFAKNVTSVLPGGFEAYARVFHPAGLGGRAVTWREVAQANGRTAHPAMQWPSITGAERFAYGDVQPGIWDTPPEEGALPPDLAKALGGVLVRFTATPDVAWYAVWEGHGGFEPPSQAPRFEIPHREMFLLKGRAGTIAEAPPLAGFTATPNLWWPDDRAWCVATEIDFNTTYVGGSADAVAELLAVPGLEVAAVDPATGITFDSDTVNPRPRPQERTQYVAGTGYDRVYVDGPADAVADPLAVPGVAPAAIDRDTGTDGPRL
ncbi:hypothetical protein [Rhizohabitans arisaemae]|uniref:hypothetical protein n=1 Tax=Rhizohabitans arisaemae TaxID=2720610 RepID=UPI0024B19D24|nr:hypothetical protein [Rhizohabitans arisaemae]